MSMVSCISVDFNITDKWAWLHVWLKAVVQKWAWLTKEAELHQELTMTRVYTSVPSN